MGNSLNLDITNNYVIVCVRCFGEKEKFTPPEMRVFLAKGGFGCQPFTNGTAVIGYYLFDGEMVRIHGYDIERLAKPYEIDRAKALKKPPAQ